MLKIAEHDAHVAALLEDGLKLPPIVARILASRGIGTCEDAERFLYPKIEHLSDPFSLPDMAAGRRRGRRRREVGQADRPLRRL